VSSLFCSHLFSFSNIKPSWSLLLVALDIHTLRTNVSALKKTGTAVPFTGLEWPRGFQEVKVPRFHDNGTGWW